jgi:hypothetical protein
MTARKTDYSTTRPDGMEFICNRWVFAGDKGYRVKPNDDGHGDDGTFNVYSYAHTQERVVGTFGMNLTEDAAHELAASLAKR